MSVKVNLRKARSIEKEIQNYLNELKIDTSTNVPVDLDEAKSTLISARTKLFSNVTVVLSLRDIIASIRDSVSEANTTSGISSLLAQEVLIKNKIKILESVKNGSLSPSDIVLKTKIEKASTNVSSSDFYGSRGSSASEISIGLITQEMIDDANEKITNLKRQRNKTNESVLALNVKTEISISDENYKYLENLGIV